MAKPVSQLKKCHRKATKGMKRSGTDGVDIIVFRNNCILYYKGKFCKLSLLLFGQKCVPN